MGAMGVEYESMGESSDKYPFLDLESDISTRIRHIAGIPNATVILTPTPKGVEGDYGVPVVNVAKQAGLNPTELSGKLADELKNSKNSWIESITLEGPYLNFRLDANTYGQKVINQILEMGANYGHENIGHDDKVAIDMSSPNIAKRMSIAHLRSTIIGDSIANILMATGFEVVKDNHIGDWGTQFGKLIVAIKRWGNEDEIANSSDPVGVLQDLYVKFHDEMDKEKAFQRSEFETQAKEGGAESVPGLSDAIEQISQTIMKRKKIARKELDQEKILQDALDKISESELEKEGREWFLKLENGDQEARRLWKLCIDLSMKEFEQIYDFLGVKFDVVLGESFYEDKLQDAVKEVKESGAGKTSDGALIVDLEDKNLGVAMIMKSDGASLYMTRDIATALYREKEMKAKKAIYVVGEDQKLYFQQLFEILRRMGHPIGAESAHVYFGMVSLPEGKKMSTRKGLVILLKDVIEEGIKRARVILKEKNPDLYKSEKLRNEVVRQITVGAMKWNDLSQDPKKPIVFDWDKALNFEGNSAPYVQYQAVRANKLLKDAGISKEDLENPESKDAPRVYQSEAEHQLVIALAEFPKVLTEAQANYTPSRIANYAFDLAKKFSAFYEKVSVLKADNKSDMLARLRLAAATLQVITNSLALLGIEVPEVM